MLVLPTMATVLSHNKGSIQHLFSQQCNPIKENGMLFEMCEYCMCAFTPLKW